MSSVINRRVFVLNRVYQLVNETSVAEAFVKMAANAFTGMVFEGMDMYYPVTWDEWIVLDPVSEEETVHTYKKGIRMPTVVVCCSYDKVPKRRPKFTLRNIARRDQFTCQYTGELLMDPKTWSMDHVLPLSRGGRDVPENVVLTSKKYNNWKNDRTPAECGIPWPKIRKLGIFLPLPTHPTQKLFVN
jgi:5-methylcytosine-specific restriction endonuclease McrA